MQSSTYTVESHTQRDGRSYVHEVHTDIAGLTYTIDYLAPAGADYAANLATHAALLDTQLADVEFDQVVV